MRKQLIITLCLLASLAKCSDWRFGERGGETIDRAKFAALLERLSEEILNDPDPAGDDDVKEQSSGIVYNIILLLCRYTNRLS